MATEIDKRVVQMEFDNKDFEKNCKESLSTLEKLKMALNFNGAKSLKDVGEAAKKVDLSHISKGAEEVRAKFSIMQVAGMTAISELTKGLLNFGKSIWSNTFGQMARGGMARTLKIDQARFQMKALANNFDEIAGDAKKLAYFMDQMHQSIDKAVSGTAYGYDAAAAVASQLMASGIKNADTMYNHLRAIAGAASMTGRSFEDIGNIFTTVASNGRLMTMQLRQFSSAGLNLSATLAKNLNKTEAQINDMVTKGQVSFEQFSKALYDSFGEAAGKADETWSGVTANVKAQLSRIGQIFTDPLVEKLIPVLGSLKAVLKQVNTVLKPMQVVFRQVLKHVTDAMKKTLDNFNVARLKAVANAIENIFASVFLVLTAVKDAFAEVFPKKTSDELYDAARNFERITQSLIPTKETLNGIKQVIKMILLPTRILYNLFRAIGNSAIKPLALSLLNLIASFLKLVNTLEPFVTALIDTIVESKLFDSILLTIVGTIVIFINILTELTNVATRVFNKVFNNSAVKEFLGGIQSIYAVIRSVLLYGLYIILTILQKISSYITADNIISVFEGIGRVIKFVLYLIQQVIGTIGILLKGISESGTIIGNVLLFIKELFLSVVAAFKGEDVSERLKKVKEAAISIGDGFKKLFNDIMDALKGIDVGKLMLIAFGMAVVFLVVQIALLVRAGTLLIRTVNGTAGILTKIKNAFLGIGRISPIAQLLFSLTLAVGTLTAALVTLSNDVEPDRLKAAAIALGALVGILMAFSIAMARFTAISPKAFDLGISSFIVLMAAIAGSLWMLTSALKSLSNMTIDWAKFISPLLAVIALMVAMGAVIVGIAKLAGPVEGEFAIGAVSMLAFAVSINILASVLIKLADAHLFEKAADALTGLIAIMGLMGTLSGAIATVALAGGSFGSGIAMIGIAISLLILIGVLKKLASAPADQIKEGFKRLILMCIPILGFIIAMGVISKVAGTVGFLTGFGGTFAGFTLLLTMLATLTMILGSMNISKIGIGILAINLIGKVLTDIFTKIISSLYMVNPAAIATAQVYMKNLKGFIIGLGAAMLMLGISAKIMSGVDTMAVLGCGALLTILGNLAIKFASVSKETEHARVAPIIAMIVAMSAMIGALAILSFQDPWQVIAAGGALTLCLIAMSSLLVAMGKFSKQSNVILAGTTQKFQVGKVIAMVAGITAIIMVIVHFLNEMTKETTTINNSNMAEQLAALAAANGGNIQASESSTDWSRLGVVGALIGAAIGIVIMSVVLYKWIDKIAKTSDQGVLLKRFSVMLSIAGILVVAIGSLSAMLIVMDTLKLKATDIMGVSFALLEILGGFAAIMWGLSQLPLDKGFNMIQIGIGLTIAASSIMVIALAIIPLAYALKKDAISEGDLVWSLGTLLVAALAISFVITRLLRYSHGLNRNAPLKVSIAMVIASSSLLIMALAIGGLAYALGKSDAKWYHIVGAIAGIAVIAGVIFTALYGMSKLAARFSAARIIAASAAMVIASSVFLVLGASIALIANFVKDLTNSSNTAFITAMIAFGACVVAMGTIFLLLSKMSANIVPSNLIIASAAFAIMAGSVGVIALACAGIMKIAHSVSLSDIAAAIKVLDRLLICFGIMAGIGAVVGVLGGVGTMIVAGMYAVSGAFILFASAVYILTGAAKNLSDAVDTIVQDIYTLNNVELSHDILTKNIEEIKQIIPQIISIFETAIHEIIVGIGRCTYEFVEIGVAFVTGFLQGINNQLPEILQTFLDMMKTIGEFLTNKENINIITDFCKSIATVLYDVVVGTLAKIFEDISDEILKLKQEYYEEDKKEITKAGAAKTTKDVQHDFLNYYSTPLKYNDAAYESTTKYWSKLQREAAEGNKRSKYLLDKWMASYDPLYVDDYDKLTEKEKADIDNVVERRRKQKITDKETFYALIEHMKKVAELNDIAYDSDELLNYGRKMSKLIGISEYFTKYEGYVVSTMKDAQKGLADFSDEVEESADKAVEAEEKVAESSKKTAEEIEEAKEKVENGDIFSGLMKKGSELFGGNGGFLETLKEKAKEGLSSFTSLFSGIGDAFGEELGISFEAGAFENCDLTDFFNKVLSDGVSEADIAGMIAGKQYANSFFENQEVEMAHYMEEANKWVQPSVFNDPRAKAKHYWETLTDEKGNQLYKSAEDYAQKQYDLNHQYDATAETLNSVGVAYDEVTEAMEEFDTANADVAASTEQTKSKFEEFTDTLHDQVADAMKNIFDDPGEMEFIDTDEMLYRMYENVRRVGQWSRQIAELASRGMSEGLLNMLRELGPAGAAKVDAFARMTAEQLQEANRLYLGAAGMPNQVTDNITKAYQKAGFNASLGFSNGIDQNAADDAMKNLGTNSLNALETELDEHSPSRKTEKMGKLATEGLANGIGSTAMQNKVYSNSVRTAQQVIKGFELWVSVTKATMLAKDFCQGLSDGFTKYGQPVVTKASMVAAAIVTAFVNRFKIGSPSKVMYDIGEYIMQGLGYGIDDGASFVERQTGQTADAIVDAMKENMSLSLDDVGVDGVYSPVIRPVFDMSLMGGWNDLTSWFASGQTVNLNGNISRLTSTNRDNTNNNADVVSAIKSLDVNGVKNEIQSMRNDISNLEASMSNLKVVMNTGALVGQLLNPMDAAMGQKAMLNSRGRY